MENQESELMIQLMQIEQTDLPMVTAALNLAISRCLAGTEQSARTYLKQLLSDPHSYVFSVRTNLAGEFRKSTVGFCLLTQIDWIARHGSFQIYVLESSKKQKLVSQIARLLASYAVEELNLNKVYTEVPQYMETIIQSLPAVGFVLDGIKKKSKFMAGELYDVNVYSLLAGEFSEGKLLCEP